MNYMRVAAMKIKRTPRKTAKKIIKKTTKARNIVKTKAKKIPGATQETTVFMNGQSEAVRIPKEFRLGTKKVYIKKSGNCIMLIPIDDPWRSLINSIGKFSDDFMKDGREQPLPQERDWSCFK